MKANLFPAAFICLCLPAITYSQKPVIETEKAKTTSIFARHQTSFQLRRNFEFSHFNDYSNDQKYGDHRTTSLDLDYNYFVVDHFGVGVKFSADWEKGDYTNLTKDNSWMGELNFTYGIPVTNRLSAYARVGVGIGGEKSVFKSNLINSTEKSDLFGFHGGLGFPIRLSQSHSYFTPRIFYDHLKTKYDDGDQVESGIRLGFGMESYLGCSDYSCDCKHGFSLSKNMYDQGHHFIGFSSMGGLDFGSSTLSLNSNNNNIKADHSRQMINLDYNYFILDYLALGAGIGLGRQKDEPKNSNYTYTLTSWNIMPVLTAHIPVTNGWNNFFVQAEGDFGGLKFVTDDAGNKTTQKSKLSGFGFGLGYNDHFSKGLSITPIIQYKIENSKDEDTNVKSKSKGFVFEIGMRSFF